MTLPQGADAPRPDAAVRLLALLESDLDYIGEMPENPPPGLVAMSEWAKNTLRRVAPALIDARSLVNALNDPNSGLQALLTEVGRLTKSRDALREAERLLRESEYKPLSVTALRDWIVKDSSRSMPCLPPPLAQWVLDALDERDTLAEQVRAYQGEIDQLRTPPDWWIPEIRAAAEVFKGNDDGLARSLLSIAGTLENRAARASLSGETPK